MRVEKATFTWIVPPPFPEPIHDATLGPFKGFPVGLIRLDSEGLSGFGFVPIGGLAAHIAKDLFLPLLWPLEISGSESIERFWNLSIQRLRNIGPGLSFATLSAIETALWDLLGKKTNRTLSNLLGGTRRSIPAYGSNGWVNFDTGKLVASVEELVARGFTLVKIKVGVHGGTMIDEDVKRVQAVRRAVGDGVRIAVDANQCWTVKEALKFAEMVAEQNIAWFEEPVSAYDIPGYRMVAESSSIPLAGGESWAQPEHFETSLRMNAISLAQPVHAVLGGISGFVNTAAIAGKYGVPVVSGGYSHMVCHLVAAAPTGTFTEFLTPFMDSFAQLWQEPPRLEGGHFHLNEHPGHGLTPNEEFCRRYQRGEELMFLPSDEIAVDY